MLFSSRRQEARSKRQELKRHCLCDHKRKQKTEVVRDIREVENEKINTKKLKLKNSDPDQMRSVKKEKSNCYGAFCDLLQADMYNVFAGCLGLFMRKNRDHQP